MARVEPASLPVGGQTPTHHDTSPLTYPQPALLYRPLSGIDTRRQVVHVLDNIVLPAWHGRTVHEIQRRDIRELVEGVAEDRPVLANRALAWLSKFFNWLFERDIIAASPCAGVKPPNKEQARDRVLTDDEIKALWQAC